MGLFDIKKADKTITALTSSQLNDRIDSKREEIAQLKKDVELAKQEAERVADEYAAKINELEEKQELFTSNIETQRQEYNNRITRLENKHNTYKRKYEDNL